MADEDIRMATSSDGTSGAHGWIGTETVQTRFGSFGLENGYPTAEATDRLYELRTFNRAVEAYLPTSRPSPCSTCAMG